MKLAAYLESAGESGLSFSKRSGVPQSTISDICGGGSCHVDTAIKIIKASKGRVRLEDLKSDGADRRRAS